MSSPKINIIKAYSFKEAYDLAPDEFLKKQIASSAEAHYFDKLSDLVGNFHAKDAAFIVNAVRGVLAIMEIFSPEDFQLAYQLTSEDKLKAMVDEICSKIPEEVRRRYGSKD